MRILTAMVATILAAVASPAFADWEWTQWGMTRLQAYDAAQGKAAYASAADKQRRMYRRSFIPVQVPELVSESRVNGTDVQAYLLFDINTAKLACVDLIPKPGSSWAPDIRKQLVAAYGAPLNESRKELPGVVWTTTTWVTERDIVELQLGGLGAKLKYCERTKDAVAELR
ncbi:MAG: hypothetical protein ACM3Q1_15665 [Bacteroidales bacterium]